MWSLFMNLARGSFAIAGFVAIVSSCGAPYKRWVPREVDLERLRAPEPAGGAAAPESSYAIQQAFRREPASSEVSFENDILTFTKAVWRRGPYAVYSGMHIHAAQDGAASQSTPAILEKLAETNASNLLTMYRDEFTEIDVAKKNDYSKRIGLALSGGGIRSASFATGVLQGLSEIGVLPEVGYLSTVSGGGYAGSWYMMQEDPSSPRDDSKILAPGSLHLQHVAQNGNYLVGSHYSSGAADLLAKFGAHIALTPGHWLFNGILDLDWSWPIFRMYYRKGLARAFLYDKPCGENPEKDLRDQNSTMAYFSPLSRRNRPFWIINMHLALTDDPTSQHRNRSGDAFELTPLRAGGTAVGYVEVPGIGVKNGLEVIRRLRLGEGGQGREEASLLAMLQQNFPHIAMERVGFHLEEKLKAHIGRAFREHERITMPSHGSATEIADNELRKIVENVKSKLAKVSAEIIQNHPSTPLLLGASWAAKNELLRNLQFDQVVERVWENLQEKALGPEELAASKERLAECLSALVTNDRLKVWVEEVVEKLESDPEVKKDLERVLRWLVGDPDLYKRFRREEIPSAAKETYERLRSQETRTLLWHDIVQRNCELLSEMFPDSIDRPNFVDWMSPSYGVAISGAAVDAQSLKQSTLATLAIEAFNYDLGYFVDGWANGWVARDKGSPFLKNLGFYATSPFFVYGLMSRVPMALGSRFDFGCSWHEHTQWAKRYHLTDGGHFDNLGVYALVRRGCRLIIVSDGAEDPLVNEWDHLPNAEAAKAFVDLRDLEMKLVADFGAEVEMEWDTFSVHPSAWEGSTFTDHPPATVFCGTIKNLPVKLADGHGQEPIKIIYIKAAYDFEGQLQRSSTFVDLEKTETPEFPHEPTSHVLYSERKVLAYRQIGRKLVTGHRETFEAELAKVKRTCSSRIWERPPQPLASTP